MNGKPDATLCMQSPNQSQNLGTFGELAGYVFVRKCSVCIYMYIRSTVTLETAGTTRKRLFRVAMPRCPGEPTNHTGKVPDQPVTNYPGD